MGGWLATTDSARRIRLPGDLPGSLKFLEDGELQRLRDAVAIEIKRRASVLRRDEPARTRSLTEGQIPEGKANLIRASFKAGLTPPAIARSLGMPLALVRRVLKSESP